MTGRCGVAVVVALAVALALSGCHKLTPEEQRTVRRYLLCEECREGEEEAVLALGARGEQALREAALEGPPPERVENMRLQAEAIYNRIPNPSTTRGQYLAHYLGNYKALYQKRAAKGLLRFATQSAHATLIGGVRRDSLYRDDVDRAFGAAAGVVVSVASGDGQDGAVDSLLRVNPTVKVVDTTTGQALTHVRVVFRVDSGGVVLDTVRYTDMNGLASSRWLLGPTETVNTLSAVAAGQVVRFRAFAHKVGARVVILVQPSNGTKDVPITPPVKFAVHDAWGVPQPSVAASADVTVVPLAVATSVPVVGGVGALKGFSVPNAGSGLRLRVKVSGADEAISEPFDVAP
jgi:hypothetical protein